MKILFKVCYIHPQLKLDCADSMPTYPQTGQLSHHKHSITGYFLQHPFCVIHNYYKLFSFFFGQTIFFGGDQFFKKPLSGSFMGLTYMLNVYLQSLGFWHMKKEHINIFPDEISAVSDAYYDSYRA